MAATLPKEIPASLLANSIPLEWGEVAWTRADALQVVSALDGSSVAILGGDVLQKRERRFEHESSSWHSDRREDELWLDYALRNWSETMAYLKRFPDPEDGSFAYVLVFKSSS
ncbi:MAG: hypothetical protein A2Y00_07480 [Omnitrophica WOR_2 bacterium GWF2_43_52]|nr:MAG: hypothetical protein A2Y00_07480 [Omnitrophica WOR_2 bacterium GWF2_43_52]OGX55962.1 MAG: hypothetical protein A2460_02440 [Omnitrophica WOR_2 bacterium RIFOXYC2_FULL_43_9]HAH19604.1 hypothetical protein [Candidatus Omnitrophota bacterium]HBG62773.1 hypothetical protein [Candidatus Omnitrophota bacterium]